MIAPALPAIGELIPTTEGRQLLVRPAWRGAGVQLGIIGKRGSLVEGVGIDLDRLPAAIFAIDGAGELAWELNEKELRRSRRERERRHAEALASNPWLKKRANDKAAYVVRPR